MPLSHEDRNYIALKYKILVLVHESRVTCVCHSRNTDLKLRDGHLIEDAALYMLLDGARADWVTDHVVDEICSLLFK